MAGIRSQRVSRAAELVRAGMSNAQIRDRVDVSMTTLTALRAELDRPSPLGRGAVKGDRRIVFEAAGMLGRRLDSLGPSAQRHRNAWYQTLSWLRSQSLMQPHPPAHANACSRAIRLICVEGADDQRITRLTGVADAKLLGRIRRLLARHDMIGPVRTSATGSRAGDPRPRRKTD